MTRLDALWRAWKLFWVEHVTVDVLSRQEAAAVLLEVPVRVQWRPLILVDPPSLEQ